MKVVVIVLCMLGLVFAGCDRISETAKDLRAKVSKGGKEDSKETGVVMPDVNMTEINERISTIRTTDGRVFKNVEVFRVEPDGIQITYRNSGSKGMAKVPFNVLPDDIRVACCYDEDNARRYAEIKRQIAIENTEKERSRPSRVVVNRNTQNRTVSQAPASSTGNAGTSPRTTTRATGSTVGAGAVQFAKPVYDCQENAGSITLTVERKGSAPAASVSYEFRNGSARAGSDYDAKPGTLSWPAGDAGPRTITVRIVNDSKEESNEEFAVKLTRPSGVTIYQPSEAKVVIINDDAPSYF